MRRATTRPTAEAASMTRNSAIASRGSTMLSSQNTNRARDQRKERHQPCKLREASDLFSVESRNEPGPVVEPRSWQVRQEKAARARSASALVLSRTAYPMT
jgi:hypothetical protein